MPLKTLAALTAWSVMLAHGQLTVGAAPVSKNPAKKPAPAAKAGDPIDAYIKLVSPKIQQSWKVPETTTAQKVVVSMTISADGKIKSVTIKEASGDQAFDDATLASLQAIGQLPAMPAGAKNGMTLDYTFHAGSRNQAAKADHEAYVNAFSRKVNSKWRHPKVDRDYQVTIAITADKSGKLVKAEVVKPSGNKLVDEAGMTAARLAEPYPVMPATMSDTITINYTFQAGPGKDVVNKMQFNGVPLPKGDYQISSGGAQLKPLDVDTAINRKLQEREMQMQERMLNLKNKLGQEIEKSGGQSVATARLQHEIGNCAVELHEYTQAESSYKAALPVIEADTSQSGELHSLLSDFAQMYVITARLKDADALLSRAVELGKTAAGINPQRQRQSMEDYARLLYKLNRTKEADDLYKQLRAKPQ